MKEPYTIDSSLMIAFLTTAHFYNHSNITKFVPLHAESKIQFYNLYNWHIDIRKLGNREKKGRMEVREWKRRSKVDSLGQMGKWTGQLMRVKSSRQDSRRWHARERDTERARKWVEHPQEKRGG